MVATPPGERHGLPALMAAACLREDRWLVHHLATDLPVAEVTRLADAVGADLVVFSSATRQGARRAAGGGAGRSPRRTPGLIVLTGRPGDSAARPGPARQQTPAARPPASRTTPGHAHRKKDPPMARYQATVTSQHPAADTFSYLATFTNAADWDPGVISAEQLDSGPGRAGHPVPAGRAVPAAAPPADLPGHHARARP